MSCARLARALVALCAFAAAAAGASQHVYIAGIAGNSVTIIDTSTQAIVGQTGSIGIGQTGIAVNGDGSQVFAANLGTFSPPGVWDFTSGGSVTGFVSVAPQAQVFGLAFDTAANRVYAATPGALVSIDPATRTVAGSLAATVPFCIIVNPASTTGRIYYSDQADNVVVVVDSSLGVTASIPVGARPQGMALDPSGTRLYVANFNSDSVSIISTATNTVIQTVSLPASSQPMGVVVDPTGNVWYVAEGGRNHVEGFSTATNAQVLDVAVGNGPGGIDVDAAGRLYVPNQLDDTVTVIQPGATPSTQTLGPVAGLPIGIGRFIGPGTPDPPTGVTVAPGDTQATVSFSAPASDGGKPITSYTATCGTQSASASSPPTIVVTGLANGTAVDCTVTATNVIGTSGPSSPPVSVTPATAPGAPANVAAAPGNTEAIVTFTPPVFDGGSPIVLYVATCGSQSATGPFSPIVVTGLANGTPVNCTVTASNAVTSGPASSPPVSVIPVWRSFTGPVATGLGSATASFSGGGPACTFAPQGTGALESAFFIPVTGSPKSPPAAAPVPFPFGLFDFVLIDCTPGSTVTFTIVYPAAIPAGARYVKYGPTASQPAPHWYVLPAAIAGNTATFSITDASQGDDDLAPNGIIVDQGGPGGGGGGAGGGAEGVPTLSEWALVALAALLGLSGAAMRPRGAE